MQRLYCYVDESGQHSLGAYFLVSVVLVEEERDRLEKWLLATEKATGKRHLKWHKSRPQYRQAYIEAVLAHPNLKGKLFSAYHHNTRAYVDLTIEGTAKAVQAYVLGEYKATILVDGLQKAERNRFAVGLRQQGILTYKVVGRDDEKDPLIRLADALCGFVGDAMQGEAGYQRLLRKAQAEGWLRLLS